MLESDAYDDKEINIVKEKLSTAEEANKMLIQQQPGRSGKNNIWNGEA